MRNRNMYRLTGLPGWMRFGYSPGWVGRSASGLGPCAEYMLTGQWPTPQMQEAFQQGAQPGFAPTMGAVAPPMGAWGVQPDPQFRLQMLKAQAQMLKSQLDVIQKQIDDLEATDE
jgi:hypothetical protein